MPDTSAAFRDKTILVTGGAGAIGTNLVAALSRLGAKRIVVLSLGVKMIPALGENWSTCSVFAEIGASAKFSGNFTRS